jgi:hypothetical protein
MGKKEIGTEQEEKVKELHWEIQQWKANLQFMDDELIFIDRLLDSYVFQHDTPNLFERLQDFKTRSKKAKTYKQEIHSQISKHENTLGGMLACKDSACDLRYYRKHDKLKTQVEQYLKDFRQLKSGIFNYAGGILKKRQL